VAQVLDGNGLPWKLATWGSSLDERLLRTLARRFPSVSELQKAQQIIVSQGLELRRQQGAKEELEAVPEVIGKDLLDVNKLKNVGAIFAFPQISLGPVEPELAYARKRGGVQLPLSICRPPHVIVSAARSFAIYSDEFIVVPSRQIGIASPSGDKDLLKAISLFLSSDFAYYQQFLTSTEFGVKRDRATLGALRNIPCPVGQLSRKELRKWVALHTELVRAAHDGFEADSGMAAPLFGQGTGGRRRMVALLKQLNALVFESLGLDKKDQALVRDLVHVRFELSDGKVGPPAVRKPTESETKAYAKALKCELDGFIDGQLPKWHKVVYCNLSGMVRVELISSRGDAEVPVAASADKLTAAQFETARRRLRKQRSQWIYFDRNLRIYQGPTTFILKPMQRFHWTETQARIDAREIIAETVSGGDGP
jgi:hypothetical protein